jgi:hypothetical protein
LRIVFSGYLSVFQLNNTMILPLHLVHLIIVCPLVDKATMKLV